MTLRCNGIISVQDHFPVINILWCFRVVQPVLRSKGCFCDPLFETETALGSVAATLTFAVKWT